MAPFAQLLLPAVLLAAPPLAAQRFHEREPNDYGATAADNAVTSLDRRLQAGEAALPNEGPSGRLRALLKALGVPAASQTLVFTKTSLRRHLVSPQNPRATYFGPDVYVGWIPGAPAIEVAVGDPRLGMVFYTLSQDASRPPRFERDDSCLSCHASMRTGNEPGLLARSVFADAVGEPIAEAGAVDVTHRTPIEERWGGWLVTGRFEGAHRGNGIAARGVDDRWQVTGRAAEDLRAFAADFRADVYPVDTSDIGALLVLEHQITVHNLLVGASMQLRHLLECDRALNAALGEAGMRDSTAQIADGLAREIAAALLLDDEPPLEGHDAAPDRGFAAAYFAQWPKDAAGVGLGELDLRRRTFVLPMSPMVHSPAFASMPDELRQRVLRRLHTAIERGVPPGNVRLTTAERLTIRDHLRASVAGWPPPPPPRRRR